jgi:hypothetical protein
VPGARLQVGVDDPTWHEDPAAPPPRSWGRRHPVIVGLILLVVGVAVYCVVAAGVSRQDYGIVAFWRTPNRIDYCGRRYYGGGTVQGSPASFTSEVDPRAEPRWQTIGHTFSLRPIEAPVAHRRVLSPVCTMVLYIPIGDGQYRVYSLSGGP